MRRILASSVAVILLSACGAVAQLNETPQQVVSTASDKYQIVPDKNKVADQVSTQEAKDLMGSMLESGTMEIEVWIGKDDHLLHRLKNDTDAAIDLTKVMAASGQQPPAGFPLPAGASVRTVVHATIDYHDFNAPVTVSVPATSS